MSTGSSGDTPSPMPLDGGPMNRDAVPELVQLFQAQSASAVGSQSNGARDMFKAGHRRLRQLTLRQRKPSDPKSKAEEASRQLLALQEEGFLPAPKAKKPASSHKSSGSSHSTLCASQSTTNLSFKSDSRRDVERIGQPWLGDPLERVHSHELNTQLSSLDLRELTSLVEAAVSLPSQMDDTHPPPYQPSPQPTPAPATDVLEKPLANNPSPEPIDAQKPSVEQTALSSRSGRAGTDESKAGAPTTTPNPVGSQNQPGDKQPEPKEPGLPQPSSKHPSNPTSQTLKLFPDTLPPRVSSKAAWRISNSRSPGPNRALPPTDTLRISTSASHPVLAGSKSAGTSPSKGQEPAAKHPQGNRSLTSSPIHERFPPHRNPRRPASLPLGSIHSFPLPAPMRPLPSLPEPVAGINTTRDQPLPAPQGLMEPSKNSPGLQPPFSTSADRPETKTTGPSDQPRLMLSGTSSKESDASAQEDSQKNDTIQLGITPFVRMGHSRAERVRALKLKDMSASRLNLTDDSSEQNAIEKPLRSPRFQTSTIPEKIDEVPDSVQEDGESRPVSKQGAGDSIVPSPLSPPALNLQPAQSNPPTTNRSCSSPLHFHKQTAPETSSQRASLSASSRGSAVSRSNSSRSSNVGEKPQISHSREIYSRAEVETPIPSSDDECMGMNKYTQQPRPSPTKRRRLKPAPPVASDTGAHKVRHEKKHSSRGYAGPTTPRKKRCRAFERMSPQSQSTCCSQDSRDSRHYQNSYVLSLEGRITHLERQNKVLQAALMAALDLGEKPGLETLLGGSASSLSTPYTGRSFSSMTNSSSLEEPLPALRHERYRRSKSRAAPYQPENWIASPGSSRGSNYTDDSGDHVRDLEDMMEDFDFGWMSDKSGFDRVQRPGIRA